MASRRVVLEGSQAALATAVLEHEQRVLAELRQYIALRLAPIRIEHALADGVQARFGMDGDKAIMEVVEPDVPATSSTTNGQAVIPPTLAGRKKKRGPAG